MTTTRTKTTKNTAASRVNALLAGIAHGRLGIETLTPAGSDRADFREVSVQSLRRALLQAFLQGYQDGAADRGAGLAALQAQYDAS